MSGGHNIRRQPLTRETEAETGVNERTPQMSIMSALEVFCRLRGINMPTSWELERITGIAAGNQRSEFGTPEVKGGHDQEEISSRGKKKAFDYDNAGSLDCGGTILVGITNGISDETEDISDSTDDLGDDTDAIINTLRKARKPSKTSATDLVHSPPRPLSQSPPADSAIPNSWKRDDFEITRGPWPRAGSFLPKPHRYQASER
ncbi:hypothetical protein HYALB_00007942 [Hymenoscyphus albidus]|uniref:Uncharacterized protein n=1 Tax=Hymenoscyphus albidus TaxID=595503 RepID=A0A9N9LRB6_9HELO|nr:hypothetical protein HYALB_00007942 [Hymenoscyphus albidus]